MCVSTWAEIATALASWALVCVTIWVVRNQNLLTRSNLCASLQLQMEEKFDNPVMLAERSKLAKQLLSDAPHDEIQEGVMNFFETVGTMLRKEYLDPDMTWSAFSFFAIRWWSACKHYITTERARQGNDETVFEEFQTLVDRMYEFETKKRKIPRAQLEPCAKDVTQFLNDERKLV